jgi:hypothetical protein
MRIKQPFPTIPQKSIYYLLLCSIGILMFILIGLYPVHSSLSGLDEEIAGIKARIEEQKVLFPLYKELAEKVRKKMDSELLRYSGKIALSIDQIDAISTRIREIAEESNLETISITPDAKSLANNSKSMSVSLVVRGDFLKFHRFLFDLESVPYLEHIQEIQIQEALAGREFRLKTWVAVSREKSKLK